MPIDRQKLLEGRQKAQAALAAPGMPEAARALYKKALDHADLALLLDDALTRKQAREPSASAAPTKP